MAAVNPPYVIQDQSHASDGFRRMVRAIRTSQGVDQLGDMAVTQNGTPNMSVNVASGLAIIDGTQDALHQGSYVVLNDAPVNLSIAAADPTNPRIDLIVAQVQDTQYSGITDAWSLSVVTGTPAPSPAAPAAPANSIVLAQVAVAALAASITNGNITDTRSFSFNSIFPVGTTGAHLGVPNAGSARFIGRWTTTGAPTAATFAYQLGDFGYDSNNARWYCIAGGSPGTWQTEPMGTLAGGYASTTTVQGGITALTDLTSLTVTVTVGAGRRIRVTGKVKASSSVGTDGIDLRIREGATDLDTCDQTGNTTDTQTDLKAIAILTPTAGSHTYKLSLERRAGTGTVATSAGATSVCFIHVEDIGV